MHWFNSFWHWVEIHTGTVNESGPYYGFWSGFGSDLGEVTIVGGLVALYRRSKCQSCWRPALRHGMGRVEGTHYETCHKHTTAEHHERLGQHHLLHHPDMHSHLNRLKETT